ncbi:MAG TPA: hypothetical protein PLN69_01330 [bacterium]|nr:hypothetical protein [bacterium]
MNKIVKSVAYGLMAVMLLMFSGCSQDSTKNVTPGKEYVQQAFRAAFLHDVRGTDDVEYDIPDFEILLMDGTAIVPGHMKEVLKSFDAEAGSAEAVFTDGSFKISAIFTRDNDRKIAKKKLNICRVEGGPVTVDSVVVDRARATQGALHGGLGQPVFTGNLFFGLEFPGAYNTIEGDVIQLRHYPGKTLSDGECFETFEAVTGWAGDEGIEEAFRRYIDSIRYTTNSNLHYNSWYDVRANNMSVERFAEVFDGFKKNLVRHNVELDYLVVDDGWQKGDSIWETSERTFPNDFGPLRDVLEAGGTELGIWMPLTGYGLNVSWGRDNGYETDENDHHYCMAGKKFNEAMRRRIKQLVEEEGVRYFKHDFNFFTCFDEGVDYPQTERHSFEANLKAEIGLLNYIHSVNPEVFLNVTSNMWLSPWFLACSDAIWMGSSDYGYDYGAPALEPRDWAMTYRDGWLYKRLVEEGLRFPMNAIMTHGIIDGVRNRLGGEDEGFLTWADNVMLYFGRGVYMRELYLSPELMDERKWKFLAEAAKWAKSMDRVFSRTDWVGGDPRRGELYGYHHHGWGKNWYVLRNPGIDPQSIDLDIDEGLYLEQLYPSRRILEHGNGVIVPGHSVWVLRSKYIKESDQKYYGHPASTDTVSEQYLRISGPEGLCGIAGDAYECTAEYRFSGVEKGKMFVGIFSEDRFLLNDIDVNGKKYSGFDEGIGWRLFEVPVKSGVDFQQLKVRVPRDYVQKAPFASEKYRISFYLNVYGEVTLDPEASGYDRVKEEILLPPMRDFGRFDYWYTIPGDRQGRLDFTDASFGGTEPVTKEQLKSATGAKLRLKVFGSRGQGSIKMMLLNGVNIGMLPENRYPYDFWHEFVVELPVNALKSLRVANKFVVNDMTGTSFKFKDVQLSVRLADGSWKTTRMDDRLQCSDEGWDFAEGKSFKGLSKPLKLEFQ